MRVRFVSLLRSLAPAVLCLSLLGGLEPLMRAQQNLVNCKPMSERTGETGCWILASQPLGVLADPVYLTLETFASRKLATLRLGQGGTVVEALGKIWLLSVGPKLTHRPAGTSVKQVGPLPIQSGQHYTAQYMEGILQPGMVSRTHVHSGVEVFYTESGETCVETPEGKQVGSKGKAIVVPQGVPMELTATGTQAR